MDQDFYPQPSPMPFPCHEKLSVATRALTSSFVFELSGGCSMPPRLGVGWALGRPNLGGGGGGDLAKPQAKGTKIISI